ncbi:Set1C complex protein [Lineolata rhizophorae]|uniref:Set1C complex protein n=1 Tax=Lineolata rhizophorae TaxID=578093 RepID=A0A6A6PFA4_9PEZI|nr:Set1C complex protein [Lineolata rhizophorae]
MADASPSSRGTTPTIHAPRRTLDEDHAPAVSSPLNPNPDVNNAGNTPTARPRPAATKPLQREQREKRETFKKREAHTPRGSTPDVGGGSGSGSKQLKATAAAPATAVPSPMRYSIPEPRLSDYEGPKDPIFTSHEPVPFMTPDGERELKKPTDHAENKKAYRYTHCVADPLFRHKQFYRQSDQKPYGPRMSFEDSDKWMHYDESGTFLTNEKGWRMARANVVAREGSHYYEVKIVRGISREGPPTAREGAPQPHIRMGWARREAPLDAPVGFDSYSYGVTDMRFETMYRSRASRITQPGANAPKPKQTTKNKRKASASEPPADYAREGDVIGLEINLPSISLHQKVVEGYYNPAVDLSAGFDDPPGPAHDIIRDRIPVPYKGNVYFEQLEYQMTKGMEAYSDRGPFNKVTPSANHEDVSLRSLPHSSIKVYKNGKLIGTAFEDLMAFLPPASAPQLSSGARVGFDDGMLGYFPAIAAFSGGIAQLNFGPDFWCPPPHLVPEDVEMTDGPTSEGAGTTPSPLRPMLKAISDRFKEQIAEDVVWDLVDEVDFFMQDGGFSYTGENGKARRVVPTAGGIAKLKEEADD